jgi:hypothetical protein
MLLYTIKNLIRNMAGGITGNTETLMRNICCKIILKDKHEMDILCSWQ